MGCQGMSLSGRGAGGWREQSRWPLQTPWEPSYRTMMACRRTDMVWVGKQPDLACIGGRVPGP